MKLLLFKTIYKVILIGVVFTSLGTVAQTKYDCTIHEEEGKPPCTKLCSFDFLDGATVEEVQQAIDEGWDVNGYCGTFLDRPSFFADRVEILKVFLKNGLDVSQKDIFGDTPLHKSIFYSAIQYEDKVKFLLEHDADVNEKNNDGETPIVLLANDINASGWTESNLKILLLFLNNGASLEDKNHNGYTVLELIRSAGNPFDTGGE